MATDHNTHGHPMSNPEVAFEKRDLGARNILLFFAILFIVGVIVHFVIWGVYGAMEKVVARNDPALSPMKPPQEPPRAVILQNTPMVDLNKFATPRLQSDEIADMATLNRLEDQILNGEAWIDDKGTVHLPIDVAMQQVLQRGLPTRAAGASGNSAPVASRAGGVEANAPQTTGAPKKKQ